VLPGRKDVSLSAAVRGGETLALAANFADTAPGSNGSTSVHGPARSAEPSKGGGSTLGLAALGIGGALLGTAVVLAAFVLPTTFDTFEHKRGQDDPTDPVSLSSARRLQVFTVVGYAAGGVLAATGLVMLLWPKAPSTTVKAGVSLGGAVVSGTF
jgi:hypothetical protein